MFVAKNKVTFKRIGELIQQFDTVIGLFLFKEPTGSKTRIEQFYSLTLPGHALAIVVLMVSTLFVTNFSLISIIYTSATSMIAAMMQFIVRKMIRNKNNFKDMLVWCEDLYDMEKNFPETVLKAAEIHLRAVERRTCKAIKLIRAIIYVAAVMDTIGFAIVQVLLPDEMFPKFSLPMLFYLPFKEQNSYLAWITTVLVQLKVCIDAAAMITYIFGIFFCIVLHVLGYLDIVKETVEHLKQDLLVNIKGFDEDQVMTVKPHSSLQLETLEIINESSTEPDGKLHDNETVLNNSIKIITEMLCNVNSVIGLFSKLYTEFFLLMEISSLSSLFICGLTFTVIHEQYFYAICITFPTALLFCICFINEKFLESLDDIKEAFYDIPWYGLTPKQRKVLLIVMNCDQIQGGFTAAGIHGLSMERFGIVVKAGYSNLLVLKDLVQK